MAFVVSNTQFAQMEAHAADREMRAVLTGWAVEMDTIDPVAAQHLRAYHDGEDYTMLQRIADLTSLEAYQKQILLLTLSSGMDFTTHPSFAYLRTQPYMTGNTKARHIILMAHAFQAAQGAG